MMAVGLGLLVQAGVPAAAQAPPCDNGGISRDSHVSINASGPRGFLECPAGTSARIAEGALRRKAQAWQAGYATGTAEVATWPTRLHYPKRDGMPYQTGLAVVTLFIGEDGDVRDAFVSCTSDDLYNDSAVDYARRFKFQPMRVNGRPARATVHQPVSFDASSPTPAP